MERKPYEIVLSFPGFSDLRKKLVWFGFASLCFLDTLMEQQVLTVGFLFLCVQKKRKEKFREFREG